MPHWLDIGKPQDFQPPPPNASHLTCLDAAGTNLVVCHTAAGQLFAFQNVCPHAGMPLHQGELTGKIITCPHHAYSFNIATGKNTDHPSDQPLQTFPIRIENNRVLVNLQPDPAPQ